MKVHPSDDVLEEFLLSLGSEHRTLVRHLADCRACRDRLLRLPRPQARIPAEEATPNAPDYEQVFEKVAESVQEQALALVRERKQALGLFVELMEQPVHQREILLGELRFHTWGVFELLIDRSWETSLKDPGYSEELARLALQLSDRLNASRYKVELIQDLRARTWAYIGNARRLASDLGGAEEAFATAESFLEQGTKEPIEQAILLDLKASLRRSQRRFDDALRLLRRSVSTFLRHGARHRAGRSLVNMSLVHNYAGQPEEGMKALVRALDLLDPEQEPRLLLCARHNLIGYMAEAGRLQEALELYHETRPLYRDFIDSRIQNRRKWLKGKIDQSLGRLVAAESLLRAARDGFLAEGIPYETALVSMDLALLYAGQGRRAELKQLAEEMVPIFASRHIHREALAALAFFKQAVEAEQASLEVVTRVAAYLREAEHDSALPFRETETQKPKRPWDPGRVEE